MIKELIFEIEPIYSCQVCHKEFTHKENVLIIESIQPVCSDPCRLIVMLKTLKSYNNNQLKQALETSLPNFRPKTRSSAISKLAVWMLNKRREVRNG